MIDNAIRDRSCIAGITLYTLSILFNIQQAVLCIPVLLFVLMTAGRERKGRDVALSCAALLLTGAIPYVLLPFLSGAVHSMNDYIPWLTYHPNKSGIAHLAPDLEGGLRGFSGLLSLLANTDGATSAIKLFLQGDSSALWRPQLLMRLFIAGLTAGFLIVLCVRGSVGNRRLVMTCWLAIACIWLFSLFWLGSDPQFWLPAYPFILILAARGLSRLRTRRRRAIALWSAGCLSILLVLMNFPINAPSLFVPDGGKEYRSAVAAAKRFDSGILAITVAGEWTGYLRQIRRDVEPVDLTTMTDTVSGSLIEILVDRIDRALLRNRHVLFEDLDGPLRPERSGPWEIVHTLYGLNREELRSALSERYRITPVSGSEEVGLMSIRALRTDGRATE